MLARCCYLVVAISIIGIFLFTCFFHIISDSTCEGEWGLGNLGEQKNGIGRCVWRFGISSVLSNGTVFMKETIYEGGWLNGTKHGYGKYQSFSNIVYEGFWRQNKREGDGIMTINERAKYIGKWENDTLTCDDASLILLCNSSCLQYLTSSSPILSLLSKILITFLIYPSQILTGTMTFKGKSSRGLPHGFGILSFSDSPRKIQITFFNGVVQDHSRGTLTLASGRVVNIDSFRESWEFLQHTAHAELSYSTPAGIRTQYAWDGLRVVVDGDASTAYGALNTTYWETQKNATHGAASQPRDVAQVAEVYELLNSLKWFEYHFIKTQMMLESDVYSFDTQEQLQRELERRKEAEIKKDPLTSIVEEKEEL